MLIVSESSMGFQLFKYATHINNFTFTFSANEARLFAGRLVIKGAFMFDFL